MAQIKQSTTYNRMFLMVLSSDHLTGATGKTPAVTISKNSAAFAAAAGVVTEIASGWYNVALTVADTGTLKDLAFHITATSCDPTDFVDQVVALDPFTATVNPGASGITSASFAAGAVTSSAMAADCIGSSQLAATAASEIATAVLDAADAIETGLTPRQFMRLAGSALAGKVSGAATSSVVFRNIGDTKNRITASVDSDGNRTAVTVDAT
jgi:hypothetical protein